jgi:hypothetical protein
MTDITHFEVGGNTLESRAVSKIQHMLRSLTTSAAFGDIRNQITVTRGARHTQKMVNILKRLATHCSAKTLVTTMPQKLHISDNKTVSSNCHNIYVRGTTYMYDQRSVNNCTWCYLPSYRRWSLEKGCVCFLEYLLNRISSKPTRCHNSQQFWKKWNGCQL